ncbi:MAG: ATPase [Nitrosomonadales bacterium]|nr:ATPase [Nitrosomonadales bacterium]
MADETLKRLLEAETKAEQVIARADAERRAIIEQAQHDSQLAEQHHAARVADIHATFRNQAEQRSQQTIAELKRRHGERSAALRQAAERNRQQATDAAVALLVGDEKNLP